MEDTLINQRVKQIRLESEKTQQEFAKDLNITQGNLSLIESGKSVVTLQTIKLIRHKYDITYDWLIDGIEHIKSADSLIPLVDKSARAGYPTMHGTEDYEKSLALYKIPGFEKGTHRIFEIEGDSMLPTLLPHDHIVTAKIEDYSKIVNGSLCVIISNKEVMAKRLYQPSKGVFRLESDNINYEPIIFNEDEIQEIWGVLAKLTQTFQRPMSMADETIDNIKNEMSQLKKEIEHIKNNMASE
ncbi:MAG: LexA family transcriptional regulator [Cyclobacteriaceae bacterium]